MDETEILWVATTADFYIGHYERRLLPAAYDDSEAAKEQFAFIREELGTWRWARQTLRDAYGLEVLPADDIVHERG